MSKIETGRFSDLLRRTLGMKGVSDVASELSPEIAPALILESERPEWAFLKNEKLMGATYVQGNAAGLGSACRLRNPAGSGVMAVFSAIAVGTDAVGTNLIERNTDQGNLATVLPTVSRDTRFAALNTSALIQSSDNVGASGESFASFFTETRVAHFYLEAIVLLPGFQLQISGLSLNVSIRGYWVWLEKRLDILEAG